jgi:hypothetical protein
VSLVMRHSDVLERPAKMIPLIGPEKTIVSGRALISEHRYSLKSLNNRVKAARLLFLNSCIEIWRFFWFS